MASTSVARALSLKMKNSLVYVQILRVEGLLFLHQAPGNDQKFGGQLHPHLRLDSFLPLSATNLIGEIDDEIPIPYGGNHRCLIKGIPQMGLALFRNDRDDSIGFPPTTVG